MSKYKNPNQVLPPGVTIINRDELKQLREENANLRAQLAQATADNEDAERAFDGEDAAEWQRKSDQENTYEENR